MVLAIAIAVPRYFIRKDFMRISKVCQRWGEQPLENEAFKAADNDESVRAGMACALPRNQDDHVGMDQLELLETFGDSDGYYRSGMEPAYMIEAARTQGQGAWQIVFLVNGYGEVTEIVVHKNWC